MFCKKCGNQLNDGAVFCPKCGTAVTVTEVAKKDNETHTGSMRFETGKAIEKDPQKNDGAESKPVKAAKKIASIIWSLIGFACVAGIILVCFLRSSPGKQILNNNLGANTPEEIGIAYVNALKYNDFSRMNLYLDQTRNYDIVKQKFESDVSENGDYYSSIDLNKISYEPIETSDNDGDGLCDGTLKMYVQDNALIFKTYYSWELYVHQAETAQGIRWFLAK